jgi:hypothetical protein
MIMMNNEDIKLALQSSLTHAIAESKGATGELRQDLTSEAFKKKKRKRKIAKSSKRNNRK